MDYLSSVRVLDTDYKIKDEEAARINNKHKIEEIEGAAKEGHKHQASEIDGLSTVATSGSYSDLEGKPSAATDSADGLMSAADKKKLDNKVDNTAEGVSASLEKLPTWEANPTDSTQLVRRDTNGTAEYGRVTFRTVWNYIKGKADAVYAAVSHTHSAFDVVFSPRSANTGSIDPVHAGFMGAGRCMSAFLPPSGIKIEYSNDGGDTWLDYCTKDAHKRYIASMTGSRFRYRLGGPDASGALGDMLRVTYEPSDGRYGRVMSALVGVSLNGGSNLLCGVETSTLGAKETWVKRVLSAEMGGRPAMNVVDLPVLTFGGYAGQTTNTYGWRFTFAKKADVPGKTQEVLTIDLYGDMVWNPVNEMMRSGRLYSWDVEGKGHFIGSADSATEATKLAAARTVSISGAVSGSAKFDGSGNVNISTTANESYISSPISGLYNMAVDADGNLWVYHSDSDKAPNFEYDSATGNLYYVTEA